MWTKLFQYPNVWVPSRLHLHTTTSFCFLLLRNISLHHTNRLPRLFFFIFQCRMLSAPLQSEYIALVGMIAQTGSVYLTLCVSIERYVAVCLPLRARSICTFGRARCFVALIGVFALLYNVTRFLEVTWHTSFYSDVGNVTAVVSTDLRENSTYISVYITWMYLVSETLFSFRWIPEKGLIMRLFLFSTISCSCTSCLFQVWRCSTCLFTIR